MQSIRRTSASAPFSPPIIEFLKRPLAAQLATVNPSGSPQQTIMWFHYEEGDFLFTTTTDRVKFRNFQHDPRASLTIVDPENMRKWVIVTGTLSVAPWITGTRWPSMKASQSATWMKRGSPSGGEPPCWNGARSCG